MAEGNPFGAPVQAYGSPTSKGVGNPFDPMQQDPFAAAPPPPPQMDSAASVSSAAGHSVNSNPFGAVVSPPQALSPPPAQHQQQQQQQQYHAPVMAPPSPGMSVPGSGPYGQPQYGQPGPGAYPPSQSPQQSQQQQQYSQGAPPAYGGHHQGQVPAGSPYDNALVPSQQPTNPYAIVPVASTQQGSQWSVGGGGAQPMAPQVSSSSFDPFAPPPPPAPAPAPQPAPVLQSAPAPQPVYAPAPEPAYAPAPAPQQQDPSGYYPSHQAPAPAPAPYSQNDQYNRPAPALNQNQSRFAGDMSDPDRLYDTPTTDPTETEVPRNRYSQQLARVAPPGASPLPKSELVRKKGFVLSRISFRTIVMKKWKQSFWVQYGPHTMLWFRSRSDFDDWLNNPYHNQAERNFLIKLAVNFVHDLYKPNVRGYQVTQCRTKGYGKKMVRQFKLERWMDYGPTIAAAFGSYNPKEVDDLREALVECMRNTPLNGGIRATGAVRQQQAGEQEQGYTGNEQGGPPGGYTGQPYDRQNGHDQQQMGNDPSGGDSVASGPGAEADLLDVDNWDDVPLGEAPATPNSGYGGYPAGAPPQQAPYANAIVPVAGPPSSYPGAPPPQQYQQQYQQPPQQQYQQPPQQQQYQQPPQQQQYQQPPQQQQQFQQPPQQYQQYQQPPPQQQYQQQQPNPAAQQDPWATPQVTRQEI